MGYENESDAQVALQQLQFVLDRFAQVGVQRAQGFVQQKDVGFHHQGPRQGDALTLAA